jgi:hypothetical protein
MSIMLMATVRLFLILPFNVHPGQTRSGLFVQGLLTKILCILPISPMCGSYLTQSILHVNLIISVD